MCRHLAYLGPPLPLSALLFDPPHALAKQAWAPQDMRGGGTINADGFGVAWYPPSATVPIRYRGAMPIWTDPALPALAAATTSRAVLAAVRSATVGMPVTDTAAAPFTEGRWLFSHNGVVRGWPGSVAKLASRLPTEDLLTLDAPTDSALLWALLRDRLRAGTPPAEAVAETTADVSLAAPGSRLNLLLTDGTTIISTTVGHALSVRAGADAVLVSSEPVESGREWQAVPDGHLLVATPMHLHLSPLGRP
ncbi:ergothioneine biosynthesis protein EgtC [Actinoplanes sp. NPDC051859]|uniref:ergothioneine biosynthesis protein EgtC n=1 Tax=Actinoplanes sp. NPDC051859 TaxID=3363909 RepID=UPI00379D03B2